MVTIRPHGDPTRIDPDIDPAAISVPQALGERIAAFYGVDSVATGADWIDAMATGLEPTGEAFGIEDLCTTDESPHVLETPSTEQAYQCVLDPLIAAFATGEAGTVHTVCPVDGEDIVFTVDDGGIDVEPETAVFSLGIDPDAADRLGDPPHAPRDTYAVFCPTGNAFHSSDAYEQWAADTDAVTTQFPLEYGVTLVGELARRMVAADSTGE